MHEADVVVVGAGLAGLAAARAIAAGGASVVVVEARDRVGGRVENHDIGDGKVVEVGGQWIGPTQDRLAALARELGVDTFPTHAAGENLIEYEGSVRRFRGTIPKINPAVLGYIFEKYINQKAFGAYYTRTEITEYLCEQTIHRLVLDRVNEMLPPGTKPYEAVGDLLLKPSATVCRALLTMQAETAARP